MNHNAPDSELEVVGVKLRLYPTFCHAEMGSQLVKKWLDRLRFRLGRLSYACGNDGLVAYVEHNGFYGKRKQETRI